MSFVQIEAGWGGGRSDAEGEHRAVIAAVNCHVNWMARITKNFHFITVAFFLTAANITQWLCAYVPLGSMI
jgi:hypothetical protein